MKKMLKTVFFISSFALLSCIAGCSNGSSDDDDDKISENVGGGY